MGECKITGLSRRFSIREDLLDELLNEMIPQFREKRELYARLGVFPEWVFERHIERIPQESTRAGAVMLAATFDSNKVSDVHLGRDMPRYISPLQVGVDAVKGQSELLLTGQRDFFAGAPRNEDGGINLFGHLRMLDEVPWPGYVSGLGYFVRKIMKAPTRMKHIRGLLARMKEDYGDDPRNIFDAGVETGYARLKALPMYGEGLPYLMTYYAARQGWLEKGPYELDIPVKADRNDTYIMLATGVLEVEGYASLSGVYPALASAIRDASWRVDSSPAEADEALWTLSRIYTQGWNELVAQAPGHRLCTPAQFYDASQRCDINNHGKAFETREDKIRHDELFAMRDVANTGEQFALEF